MFVLGAAGLLSNRRATTHWALQEKLQREFPQTIIEQDMLIAQDGNITTACDAGLGTDVALCLLEEDLGAALAKRVAESLVMRQHAQHETAHPSSRPTSHTNTHTTEPWARSTRIQKALKWLEEHMASPINMVDAADSVSMSERNFQREFKRATGTTPHSFLMKIRLDAVRQYLRETDLPVDKIARRCGFFSGEHVSKLFRKHFGVSPCEYRKTARAHAQLPEHHPEPQYDADCCRSDR